MKTLEDLWNLELELREWRKELDGVSRYAYSSLMLTFALMIRYGWLKIDDLAGLEEEKIAWFRSLPSDIL